MRLIDARLKPFVGGLFGFWLTGALFAAPASAMTVTPADPTVLVGQTQQFTANGALTPAAVSGGGFHTCMFLPDGTIECWGRNQFGQLGDGTTTHSTVPVGVSGVSTAVSVAAGNEHTCALLGNGSVRCWGVGDSGQLGDGATTSYSPVPVAVSGLSSPAVDIASGGFHSCAMLSDGTVRCWGRNIDGQLGHGTTENSGVPVLVNGLTAPAALTAGGYHTCALMPDGTIQCWGRNDDGQLGDGTRASSSTPVRVVGITGAAGVTGGFYHTCALLQDGTVRCWGRNTSGQLGDGTTTSTPVPVQVSGITNAVAVVAGGLHACALLSDSTLRCWGLNDYGQLGDGTTSSSSIPVPVGGTAAAGDLAAGGLHTCALLPDRSASCWGLNDFGQLGNGTTTNSVTPVRVIGTGVTWTSSNTAVATIDGQGLATTLSRGSTTITATDGSGVSASSTLTVTERVMLTVMRQGAGSGSVTSSPSGISCGADCSEPYDSGTVVTLAAAPAAGSTFAGWSGCDTVSGTTCTVTMSGARSVTAAFALQRFTLTVITTDAGSGTVSSSPAGISCGTDCSEPYDNGTTVTLTATPAAGSTFAGWSGCDTVSGATCTVTMSATRSVTAAFARQRFTLTVSRTGAGTGTVTSSPAGVNCGTDCSEPYDSGTVVTLTATPAAGSIFSGWSGCGTVSGTSCTVTMTAARSVTAVFAVQRFTLTVNKTGLGGGTVTSSPPGINCGADCSEAYNSGTVVTLTASPALGSVFTGWNGCDAVSGTTCTVTMSGARSVTAAFLGIPPLL